MMQLSTRLRQASHDLHGVAERSGLMAKLLQGRLSRRQYTVWLLNLQAIYAALERGLAQAPSVSEIDFAPLYRGAALARDLAVLQPTADMLPCAAGLRYVARLEELSASRPRLLLAHAYVRYLGDLHGGQLLRRCVARVLQAEAVHAETAPGLAFYDFGSPARVAELISSLRAGLNAATVDDAEADALAQEARLGFAWHIDLFQELDAASDV